MPFADFRLLLRVLPLVLLSVQGLAAVQATGQGIDGRLVDLESGEPIQGAVVELLDADGMPPVGASITAQSDSVGQFQFLEISAGSHTVEVHHPGYGVHRASVTLEGASHTNVEIRLSPTLIRLSAVTAEAERGRELAGRSAPASRNVITREEIAQAGLLGENLGDLIARRVVGIRSTRSNNVGGEVCIEFRAAVSGDDLCRHPLVYLDGAVVPSPLYIFNSFSIRDLEWVQVIPPSQAGSRFGPGSAWGVLLLETRRGGLRPEFASEARVVAPVFDWSLENEPYRWGRVYFSSLVGNTLGLVAGLALVSNCMDLNTRGLYQDEKGCGAPMLVGSAVAASVLPALGGGVAARFSGRTARSQGRLRYSLLISQAVFIPAYAMIASNGKPDQRVTGLEIAGAVLAAAGAPLLTTLADRFFRSLR